MVAARRGAWLATLAVAALLPALAFLLFGDKNLNLADEGYLWYGVQRTVAGEVPLRDFQSYDPGRYHWCALFVPLFGQGILGVRAALGVFHALGLWCGLLVTRRLGVHWAWQLLFGLVLELWMFPRHKLFEPATALMACWFALRLLERPSRARYLAAGVFVGLAGYLGRNLGLYTGLSFGALFLLDLWKRRQPGGLGRLGALALGVLVGYAPVLYMLAFVPGFAASLRASIELYAREGVNLPLPWPWPWRVATEGLSAAAARAAWVESAAFLLPLLALPALLVTLLRTRARELEARAACLAPAVVGLFFLHHATVRSDAPHLAQCLHPVLLALCTAPLCFGPGARRAAAAALWSGLGLLSGAIGVTSNPILATTLGKDLVTLTVGGDELRLLPSQAAYFTGFEREVARRVGTGELFVAPNRPTLYAVLGKRAPTWWIYYFWPLPESEQLATIARLAERRVDWALIVDAPTDERDDLRFRATNPRVWQHLEREWKRVPTPGLPTDHFLFQRR